MIARERVSAAVIEVAATYVRSVGMSTLSIPLILMKTDKVQARSQIALSKLVGITPQSLQNLLQRCQLSGWVARRSGGYVLTDAGSKVLAEMNDYISRQFTKAVPELADNVALATCEYCNKATLERFCSPECQALWVDAFGSKNRLFDPNNPDQAIVVPKRKSTKRTVLKGSNP